MWLQAPHCPSCGAPVDVPQGVARVTCSYCSTTLVIGDHRVSTLRPPPPERAREPTAPYPEPDATLSTWEMPRFETSLVEQLIPQAVPSVFAGFELGEQRFAFVSMRVVNRDGAPVKWELGPAFEVLKTSLENDGDPGLAVNLALESLCEKPFEHRLEVALALFEPKHMRVTPYVMGARDCILWASSEEGRGITLGRAGNALERKSLRERDDHFANGEPIHLAAGDLVLFASPGLLGHGPGGYGNGAYQLHETVNAQLGEAPLRVVTLVKNAFWRDFQQHVESRPVPVGDIKVVAVRALMPALVKAVPKGVTTQVLRSRRYEVGLACRPGDAWRLLPLHADRQVVVWLSPVSGALASDALDVACAAVTELLDRKDYGDNENPRRAGREAYERLQVTDAQVRMAVIQLFDAHHRVKYFRAGWKQPISLGPRGVRADGLQQFDEGGEATVAEGARLFFPGTLAFEGEHGKADELARVWAGGKASRLYEAMVNHWKSKKTGPALEQLVRAAVSDLGHEGEQSVGGVALVTGLG